MSQFATNAQVPALQPERSLASSEPQSGSPFPTVDDSILASLPSELKLDDPARVYVFAEADGNNIGDALPVLAALKRRTKELVVAVFERSADSKLRAWIRREGLIVVEPTSSPVPRQLRALSERLPIDTRLVSPFAASGRTPADNSRGELPNVYVFMGRRLVWYGDESDAKFVVERASRREWSGEDLAQYEAVEAEIRRMQELWLHGKPGEARPTAKRFSEQFPGRPGGIADFAMLITQRLQEPTDADIARRLADEAVRQTEGLDGTMLRDAAFTHYMTGDNAVARELSSKWLDVCQGMQTHCDATFSDLVRRCPLVLKAFELPHSRYSAVPAPRAAADCR